MSLKINSINPFINGNIGGVNAVAKQVNKDQSANIGSLLAGQASKIPQQTALTQSPKVDPSFTSAVSAFGQKYSTGNLEVANAKANYSNNLSNMKQGALGEEALYVKGGRAGGNFNFVI